MTIRAQFPRTSAAYPGILDWDQPLDWSDAASRARILGLVIAQRRAAEAGMDCFLTFCDAVADDVGGLVPVEEISVTADTVDHFRFLFGLLPIELTLAHGMNGYCYGWVMWTIARGCDRRGRVFDVQWSFFAPDSLGAADYRTLSLKYLPRWADAVFLLARKFGGLDAVATAIADLCWQACHDALLLDVDPNECFAGLTSLANWAVNAGAPPRHGPALTARYPRAPGPDRRIGRTGDGRSRGAGGESAPGAARPADPARRHLARLDDARRLRGRGTRARRGPGRVAPGDWDGWGRPRSVRPLL